MAEIVKVPMGGWKMKTGSLMMAIGTVVVGSAEVAPHPALIPWLKFLGFIVGGVGTAFVAWGAGHKIEKNNKVLVQKKVVPFYVHPMAPNEYEILKAMRKKIKVKAPEAPTASVVKK